MAKVYKMEIIVIDFEERTEDAVCFYVENLRNLSSRVLSLQSVEVEWDDDHPLNRKDTQDAEVARLFPKSGE